jgi:hypothetical protein
LVFICGQLQRFSLLYTYLLYLSTRLKNLYLSDSSFKLFYTLAGSQELLSELKNLQLLFKQIHIDLWKHSQVCRYKWPPCQSLFRWPHYHCSVPKLPCNITRANTFKTYILYKICYSISLTLLYLSRVNSDPGWLKNR